MKQTFLEAYVQAALWSSIDNHDEPMDKNYSAKDIAPETMGRMVADCAKFIAENYSMITDDLSRAGYDFWLTRNRHGCGFWSGDWPEGDEDKLTDAAHKFGEFNLYVGDDGKIWA